MTAAPLAQVFGGGVGRHARPAGPWFTPARWVFAAGTLAWLVLVARQMPCVTGNQPYGRGCYSDIGVLWYWRGIAEGRLPYVEAELEYPVLTGLFIWLVRQAAALVPGDLRAAWLGLSAAALFACFLALLAVHLRLGRPWDAVMIAVSPVVMVAGLINWDMLPVALTSGALLAWARGRPALAGVLIGLGTAAKLYPVLLLVPIAALCLRTGRRRAAVRAVLGAAAAWLAANLPVYLASPEGWARFWTFNARRSGDLGSIWYVLGWTGDDTRSRVSLAVAALMVAGAAAIAVLAIRAPDRPRVAQLAFLVVALFCLVNKVYSPQYVLWLLPLVVLARPVWRDWAIFTVGELVYWWAVWAYLDGALYAGDGQPRLYWAAIVVRLGTQLWVAAVVVRDVLLPAHDPCRRRPGDDPHGGVLTASPVVAGDAPGRSA